MTNIEVAADNSNYSSINGALFNKAGSILIACPGLTTINIPQEVTSIGDNAFLGSNLTTINIPQGVTSISSDSTFSNCKSLTNITVAKDNLNYTSINGMLFNKTGTVLIACPVGLTTISIPQGVTSIGDNAFSYCEGINNIIIPQGVTSIGDYAFYASGVTNISIPQEVTSIGRAAFYGFSSLTTIDIPRGVTSINDSTFTYCTGLDNIRFNSVTTAIYDSAETIPNTTKIIGYALSTAKDYATKYNNPFEIIDTTNILKK